MKIIDTIKKKLKPYKLHLLALLAGGLMPLAFSPFHFTLLSFISIFLLLYCIAEANPKKAFNLGFAYGLGMFGVGVSWIYVSIHLYGQAPMPLAALFTALFVIVLALFPATMCALFTKIFPKNNFSRCIIAFPVVWVLFDLLRGWIFTGFPWLFVGNSQLDTNLGGFAPIGGIWLTTWATVLASSLMYYIYVCLMSHKPNKWLRNSLILMFIALWGVATYCNKIIWTVPTGAPISVALVQGNIPQQLRWEHNQIPFIVSEYQQLTQDNMDADIIIWPESAIPLPLPLSKGIFTELANELYINNATLIAGVPVRRNPTGYYNGLIAIGNGQGVYYKKHLVPFGEYVPFEKYLRGMIAFFNLPMSTFFSEKTPQAPLIAQGLKIAPAICYEIAYPNLIQQSAKDVDMIVTVSNDTWFGHSIGPSQHLEIARFRALETGRYVVRATNSGITAVVAPNGDIYERAPQFTKTVLRTSVTSMLGTTPWVKYGPKPVITFFLVLLFTGFIMHRRGKKK